MNPETYSSAIYEIHRESRAMSPVAFRNWIFEQLFRYSKSDSGSWINLDASGELVGASLHNHDSSILEDFNNYKDTDEHKLYLNAVAENPDTVINGEDVIPFDEILNTEVHKEFYRKHNVIHGVGYATIDSHLGIQTNVYLQREDVTRPYTNGDCDMLNILIPHVVESTRNNLLFYFLGNRHSSSHQGLCISTCDGRVIHQDEAFVQLVSSEWSTYDANRLPPLDLSIIHTQKRQRLHTGSRITIDIEPMLNHIVLHARRHHNVHLLTPTERKVAKLLIDGKCDKDIQRMLNISRSTCDDHKSQVLKKMGVRSRTQLIALFALDPVEL